MRTLKYSILYGNDLASARGKKIDYVLVTGGALLSENIAKYLNDYGVNIQINLLPQEQVENNGFYDGLTGELKKLNSLYSGKYRVRSYINNHNYNLVSAVKYFRELGFSRIHLSPAFGADNSHYPVQGNSLINLEEEYMSLALYYINEYKKGRHFVFEGFDNLISDLFEGEKRFYYSGAGKSYMAVDPEGYLYPSHHFCGTKEWQMGSVFKGINFDKKSEFINNKVDTIDKCTRCWARYFCRRRMLF